LAITERSGGRAPPLPARAAASFGYGEGKRSAVVPGRWMVSPVSESMSLIWYSAAMVLA
jgi:hypothetical protein